MSRVLYRQGAFTLQLLSRRSRRNSGRRHCTTSQNKDELIVQNAPTNENRETRQLQEDGPATKTGTTAPTSTPVSRLHVDSDVTSTAPESHNAPEKILVGHSFEELLDRIAQSQLQKDEQVTEISLHEESKKHSKPRRTTLMNIHELVEFLRQESAKDICVLRIPPEMEYVEYFIVCGGLGTRHIRSMAENLALEVKGCGNGRGGRVKVEGRDSEEWMAVDLGFAVVHMMLDDVREKYHLEKLWALGPQFDDQYIEMLKYQENQKF